MSLEITLTGQLVAEADGNRADATHLPGRQASVVFAYLVAERGRPVPSEELAEAVWGGALPPTWRPALRGVVSKVRDFLDRLGLPAADTLTSSSGCYRLVLPTDTAVDVELAEGEAGQAQRALDAGRLDEALGAAERARAIAGRPLLPGHDGAWVQDRRAALHRVLVRTLELLVEVHLAAGHIYQGAADHHLGILAATAGRWEDSLGTSGPPWPPWPPTSGSGRVPGGRSPSRPMRACSAAGTGTATGPGPPTWTRPPTPAPTGSAWRCQDGATPALGPRS
jgi:hypothetical protein